MKHKTAICIVCGQERLIYAKKLCGQCYERQRKKTPIRRSNKPIRKVSIKRQKEQRIYSKLAKQYKEENPICTANLDGCTIKATDVHHSRGRYEYYLDTSTFISVCRNCHQTIETNPALAKSLGLSFSRLSKKL